MMRLVAAVDRNPGRLIPFNPSSSGRTLPRRHVKHREGFLRRPGVLRTWRAGAIAGPLSVSGPSSPCSPSLPPRAPRVRFMRVRGRVEFSLIDRSRPSHRVGDDDGEMVWCGILYRVAAPAAVGRGYRPVASRLAPPPPSPKPPPIAPALIRSTTLVFPDLPHFGNRR